MVLLENYLPTGIVPFANDDGGNLFCISARQQDYGKILYCNNDHYEVNDREKCLTLIEENLFDFLKNLSGDNAE